jgi:predicted kinase
MEILFQDPCLVMIAGVPGAGKTTLIERAIPENAFLLAADDYRGRVQRSMGHPWDAYVKEAIPVARQRFMNDLVLLLNHGVPVFLDASYLSEHSQLEMCSFASNRKISSYLVVVTATLQECQEGVLNRERTVPKEHVGKFHEDYLEMRSRIEANDWSPGKLLRHTFFVTREASQTLCFELQSLG